MGLTAEISRIERGSEKRLLTAILVSIFLHATLVIGIKPTPKAQPQEKLIEVTFQPEERPRTTEKKIAEKIPAEVIPPKQVITQPDLPEATTTPTNTRFLSDKNTVTPKEQIKRGEGESGGPKASPTVVPEKSSKEYLPKKSPSKNEKRSEETPLKDLNLKLDPNSLSELSARIPATKETKDTLRSLAKYTPFSGDGSANNELFRFRSGSPDFLPNIPDGEVTLLNAKADRFAPFVRRVANQVFGMVRKLQWQSLPTSEVMRAADFVTVEAVLSLKGELLKVTLLEPSGSSSFDQVILQSVRSGANDQNPPQGVAAEDGNIHFVFKSRCWTRPGPQGARDLRWLLLSTGLL